jgi:hypothetical protein
MQSRIYPLKEFDTWEALLVKLYPNLKMFIHEAYSRCRKFIQLQNMAGQQGYVQQNMYKILNKEEDNDTDNNTNVVTPLEVQINMIFMGHQILSCHVLVVRSFFVF